jgi:hypothetical protein
MHCDHYWSIVRFLLSSNNLLFIHQSSITVTSRNLVVSRNNLKRIGRKFCLRCICFILLRVFLTCREILRHGTAGFISRQMEVVLPFFIALKILCTLPGLNPRTLFPMANTITTRPPRTTCYPAATGGLSSEGKVLHEADNSPPASAVLHSNVLSALLPEM